ncbi:MAG: dehydrogenase [Lachnospiraceae bacterium]|nr:dehydrogenase [Lachnospiraceae bacterium]
MNQYQKTVSDEKKNFSREELINIYRDMYVIRAFEQMLEAIKMEGKYKGKEFSYAGAAHLALGEEAAAVGEAFYLGRDDIILGTHRSHHEVIAKALSVIRKLSDKELLSIMKEFSEGKLYDVVKAEGKSVRETAEDFFLYGAICEIIARETGLNQGLGGSMHAFFLPFGIFPNNAIVAGSAPLGCGVALYKKCNKKKGVVVVNAGDGSIGCGPGFESLNFASMDQFKELWEKGYEGGLPIIFNYMNNGYGMGGQTEGETMGYHDVARIGVGISPDQLHTERVDGFNPLAVIDAYRRKMELIAQGKGPCMLDVVTYRFGPHSPADAQEYRSPEEIAAWKEQDPIPVYAKQLEKAKIATVAQLQAIRDEIEDKMDRVFTLAIDPEISPLTDYQKNPDFTEKFMFSNEPQTRMGEGKPVVLKKKGDNTRVKQIAKKHRYAYDENGNLYPSTRVFNIRDAIFEALYEKMYEDPTLITFGEDVRSWQGVFGVYRGLPETLPYHRLFNTPISESAIVGAATGYGMAGGRAVAELMYGDFLGRCGDEVFNQLAKWHAMSAGLIKMPVVLRLPTGAKYGAQHSQDWTSFCTHVPGLKVVYPSTPYDAKGLLNTALNSTDPVIFCESQRTYEMGELFHKEGVPEGYYEIPFGEAEVKIPGSDVTILNVGPTIYRCLEAVETLKKYGISAELIDARSLVPFNYDLVIDSVKKTGKVVLISDASSRGSFLNDIANNITNFAFNYLDAPPVVVGAKNWIAPAYEYDADFFPQGSWIVDAVHQRLMPIPGYEVQKQNYTDVELLRRARMGV